MAAGKIVYHEPTYDLIDLTRKELVLLTSALGNHLTVVKDEDDVALLLKLQGEAQRLLDLGR